MRKLWALAALIVALVAPVTADAATVIGSVDIDPHAAAIRALDGKVYVYHDNADTVSIIDTTDGNSVTEVSAGTGTLVPSEGMAAANGRVFVIDLGGENVDIIDGATDAVTTVSVPGEHYEIAAYGDKAYVANYDSNSVSVIDAADGNAVSTISTPGRTYTILAYDGMIYAGADLDEAVYVIDPDTDTVVATISLPGGAAGMAGLDGKVYVGGSTAVAGDDVLYVIDTEDGYSLTTVVVEPGGGGQCLACYGSTQIAAGGTHVFVGVYNANWVYIIDASGNSVTGNEAYGAYQLVAHGDRVYWPQSGDVNLITLDAADGNYATSTEVTYDPYGIALDGSRLYLSHWTGGLLTIVELDEEDPEVTLTSPADASEVSGEVDLEADASDDFEVAGVKFYVDGVLEGSEDTSDPYGITWDSTDVADGSHTLAAAVRDLAGNYATSTVTVTVANAGGGGGGDEAEEEEEEPRRRSSSGRASRQRALDREDSAAPTYAPADEGTAASPSPAATPARDFARDLQAGDTGEDVRALQIFLNTHGFPLVAEGPGSPGNETDTFGALTRAALVKFQLARGVEPAAGYFGPITRGVVSVLLGA